MYKAVMSAAEKTAEFVQRAWRREYGLDWYHLPLTPLVALFALNDGMADLFERTEAARRYPR